MSTLAAKVMEPLVSATYAYFVNQILYVSLSDGREISVPINKIPWLHWLATATPAQRQNWSLEPNGFAIYWEDLDDGI
ncbi:MAG: DUF2442 domain-containing protein [Candidatus Parabeggiatoa sp. nov. 2]|nr:MAG: hypothetical protein B6247_10835 [Beggiatoa sp. 4572_84]RKZ54220.1 MAG: DUF2442 domain-containing protein [Gammaproteobacteria bacterium]